MATMARFSVEQLSLNQKDALKGNMKNLFDQITVDEI